MFRPAFSLVCLRQLKGFLSGSYAAKYTFAPYFSQEIIRAGKPGVMPVTGMFVFSYTTSRAMKGICVWLYSANKIYVQAFCWLKSATRFL